ncbi:MAG: histidine kinase [Aureispira sp.]|nr:histidine kinase [Aureispira sp.]
MKFKKKRYKEVLVWLAYFLLLFSIAHDNWGTTKNGAEVSLFMVVVHFIIFYGNYYVLMPLTFAKKKYLLFVIGSIIFITIWVGLTYLVFSYAFQSGYWISPIEFRDVGYFRSVPRVEYLWTGRISLSGLNVFFISILYFYAEQDKLLTQRMWALEHEKVQAEVKLLRMQINPHFLFNALNNIYAQAVLEESKVADSIHKLSGLLRYTLYDCDIDEVSLMREIEYIDNYIDLQELKEPALENIDFRVEGNITQAKIAPMLLISFIENGFKHGNIRKGGWIRIELKASSTELLFKCTNSITTTKQQKDPASGIGLKNVKKRLNLNYTNRHQLTINKSEHQFEIILKLSNEHNLSNN